MRQTIRSEPAVGTVQVTDTIAQTGREMKRISWGAILAGVVVAIVTQIALNLLGLSIGASIIDPFQSQDMVVEFETATVIWIAASTLLAMFAGGWVAGRLAGIPDEVDSTLHGLATWAVVTLITLYFIISGISSVVNGAANAVGASLSMAGDAIGAVSPEVTDAITVQETTLQDIEDEMRGLQNAEGQPVTNSELYVAVRRLLREGADAVPETRESAITILMNQSGMTRPDAEATVDRWVNTYQQTVNEAEALAKDAGETVADGIATAAGVAFMAMVIGAFAAGAGGMLGAPDEHLMTRSRIVSRSEAVTGATD